MKISQTMFPDRSVIALGLALGLGGCGFNNGQAASTAQTKTVVAANTAFAMDLYGQLKTANGNLFFSPYSVSDCLALSYAGARGNTQKQMSQVQHFGTNYVHSAFGILRQQLNRTQGRSGIELSVADGLWTQKSNPLQAVFLDIARREYEANVKQVDFRSEATRVTREINAWVSEKTKGKIGEIITAGLLDENSRQVLLSAIYFKAKWKTKFDPKNTRESDFWIESGRNVKCPMMSCTGKFRYSYNDDSCEVIELPYVGNDFSLFALLPHGRDGLAKLEVALTDKNLAKWLALPSETEVHVSLPKFKLQSGFSLDKTLSAMGMTDAFTGAANFSGIDGTQLGYISTIRHEAFVEVNEEGTKAAAATVTHVATKSMRPSFRADHPFLFLIRDNHSGSILFLGRVVNPTT